MGIYFCVNKLHAFKYKNIIELISSRQNVLTKKTFIIIIHQKLYIYLKYVKFYTKNQKVFYSSRFK